MLDWLSGLFLILQEVEKKAAAVRDAARQKAAEKKKKVIKNGIRKEGLHEGQALAIMVITGCQYKKCMFKNINLDVSLRNN